MGAIYCNICIDSYDIHLLACFSRPLSPVYTRQCTPPATNVDVSGDPYCWLFACYAEVGVALLCATACDVRETLIASFPPTAKMVCF